MFSNNHLIKAIHNPIILTLTYLLLTAVAPNNKIFFVLAISYFITLIITQKSAYKAILYAYIPFTITQVGQSFTSVVVPGELIENINPLHINGLQIGYVFTPLMVLFLCAGAYLLRVFFKPKPLIVSFLFLLFITLGICSLYSSSISHYFPTYSVLYSLQRIGELLWFMLFILIGKKYAADVQAIVLKILVLTVFFEGIVVLYQMFFLKPLGLFYEGSLSTSFTSDDISLVRPVGFRNHANYLGIQYVEYLLTILYCFTTQQKKYFRILVTAIIVILLVIIASRSRSAYLATGISLLTLGYLYRFSVLAFYKKLINLLNNAFIKTILIFSGMTAVGILIPRIYLSSNMLFESGSYYGRLQLLTFASSIIKQNFMVGVGSGMFVPSAFSYFPYNPILLSFPAPVHNGFLLILAENGILALLLLLCIYGTYGFLLYRKNKIISHTKTRIAAISILTSIVCMLFQPTIIILPLPILLLLLEYQSQYEKNIYGKI